MIVNSPAIAKVGEKSNSQTRPRTDSSQQEKNKIKNLSAESLQSDEMSNHVGQYTTKENQHLKHLFSGGIF